ncbi:MAG: class I SAM-dependent methyltransferase [Actinobacteria bacterium]|nr:class I SAM-dependent methyltransferase [Actinomycetota bacterium]
MTASDRVARARSLRSATEAVDLYRDWADEYDHDVFDVLGFTGTARVADLLAVHMPDRTAPVVDLGCGTGGAGARLAEHGFAVVDGVDISPEMLEVASRRGVYRHLSVADLNQPLQVAGAYAGSVSAGTFTGGHVGADAVAGIATVLAPGAVVAWVVAEPLWPAFHDAMRDCGFDVRQADLEPVRRDGPPEARMVVAAR